MILNIPPQEEDFSGTKIAATDPETHEKYKSAEFFGKKNTRVLSSSER
ncbi:hypothetical protein [Desulfosporosinus orientis]|nr:hypothetical protein [Desulfosporosinus orientis]